MPRVVTPRRVVRPPVRARSADELAQLQRMRQYVVQRRLFHLSRPQLSVFRCAKRFRVIVAGRRFGKTFLACWELIKAALGRPNSLCWYVAPTREMARDLAWHVLLMILPSEYIAVDGSGKPMIREGRLEVTLKNGSRIALKGANNPRSLHGRSVWFCVLDEFADLHEDVLFEAIIPALADLQGSLLCIGTPKGFNYAYDVFTRPVQTLNGRPKFPDWAAFSFRTIDGGRVKAEEIELARANLSPAMFAQQFLASFTRLSDRVYENFHAGDPAVHAAGLRHGNVDPRVRDDITKPLLVGMDFNVNPLTAVLGNAHVTPHGKELHVFGELLVPSSNTEAVAEELQRYRAAHGGERRPVIVCPDATGARRQTSAGFGVTDHSILQRHGFVVEAPSRNPHWTDRIAATNALMLAGDKRRRLKVSPDCRELVKASNGYQYVKNTSIPNKDGGLDHITDALGYLVWSQFNDFVPVWEEGTYAGHTDSYDTGW